MEKHARDGEQQVWQRVFAGPETEAAEDLRPLLREAMEQAGAYRYLTTALIGKTRERAMLLYQGQMETIACLRGIGLLSGRGEELLKLWQPTREPVVRLLEKCYHRSRRSMTEYMARSAGSEFGVVFRRLADREAEHCAILAGLLGRIAQEEKSGMGR